MSWVSCPDTVSSNDDIDSNQENNEKAYIYLWFSNHDEQQTILSYNDMFRTNVFPLLKDLSSNDCSVVSLPAKDVCEPGWSFYNGSCYYTSDTCETWSKANRICRSFDANLPAIESQEENVYIQHRHNGEKAWIGLNDIATEGLFTWVDGCPDKFRYWAESQPNDFRGEDCAHTLGPSHGYMWNDVDCSVCHQYTCKKGLNSCVLIL